jgi:hypothetical protein
MAKYLGKINPIDRSAGKGDRPRPKARTYNMDLFLNLEKAVEFEKQYVNTRCYVCKKEPHSYTIIYYLEKKIVVCDECKHKICI